MKKNKTAPAAGQLSGHFTRPTTFFPEKANLPPWKDFSEVVNQFIFIC